jgi:hypothetical protein
MVINYHDIIVRSQQNESLRKFLERKQKRNAGCSISKKEIGRKNPFLQRKSGFR